ncbi:enoyl-CoA hydratase/isomerase family protein [Pseudonocardia pini]|uniref:enoyl-CoA hydratase/isomerase family protein n=1 Tax=Pseudonocardia pini TaxID=2758030 RepID=UPI0015EFFF6B|nr:enoyl-CoA hydratase-related protein [Pseudonocardia pini]
MTDTTEAAVLTELVDGVLTITLNRPRRKNALDAASWHGLEAAFTRAKREEGIRVVVLTGAGGDFCAGADLSGGPADGHPLGRMRWIHDIAFALHSLPMPTVAKVPGAAVGAGCNLAIGCDFVIAGRSARFSEIFAQRGLSLDFGGSWLLPKIVGLQQAKRLALLAEIIGAEEAKEIGLITYLVEDAELDARTDELVAKLAAGAPVALAQSKALLNEAADLTLREALEGETRAQTINFGGTDPAAAFEAFMAKRTPEFTGEWAVK